MPPKNNKPERPRAVKGFFHAIAEQYAADVLSGTIPAGKYVRLSVQRHLNDLKKAEDPKYMYGYDIDKGERVCRFIELLPHTKDKWAQNKELIVLQPWQVFIVMVLFGWLRRFGNKAGKRRFRTAYIEVCRKNGKSLLAAAIGNYMFLADGEFGSEVYSGATSEKQAWEVFKPAKIMLQRSPKIVEWFEAEVCAKVMIVGKKGSKFEPVIGNPGDGPSPSCAIVDEYHEHDTPALHDSMETGMGARTQPLMLIITTAGYNLASPCYDKHDDVVKTLEGTIQNDDMFGIIYSIDQEKWVDAKGVEHNPDDWADPASLKKANPNYGISVDEDFLLSQQRQALSNPVNQGKFKTKHLDIWCSVLNAWMNMQLWNMAADTALDEEELKSNKAYSRIISVDLATKLDLCSEQKLYFTQINGKLHYYLFGRYWLPEAAIDEEGPNHAHYKKWVNSGTLTPTDGATVDFELITQQLIYDCKDIRSDEFVYDPFNATQVAQDVMAAKVKNVVEFIQQPQNFALPMDEISAALKDGRFHHDGNPITTWCMANVVARPTKKGLFAPMKMKPNQKIDGAVATLMAVGRAVAVKEPGRTFQLITL